jgi:hypothetical protein
MTDLSDQTSNDLSSQLTATPLVDDANESKFGDPLVIANDFETGYIHHFHLTGHAEYHDPVEYLKVYLVDNRVKTTQVAVVNLFFALLIFMSLLDTHKEQKDKRFIQNSVLNFVSVTIWTYVVFIGLYSTCKIRKHCQSAKLSLDRDAENTDVEYLAKSCKITQTQNILTLPAMIIVQMHLIYKALVVFGIENSQMSEISQMQKGGQHHHGSQSGSKKASLPTQELSYVAIFWVILLNLGYFMLAIGISNQLKMRPSVRLAIRDIENSDERIGNKVKREQFRQANLDTTVDGEFSLGKSLSLEDAISQAKHSV